MVRFPRLAPARTSWVYSDRVLLNNCVRDLLMKTGTLLVGTQLTVYPFPSKCRQRRSEVSWPPMLLLATLPAPRLVQFPHRGSPEQRVLHNLHWKDNGTEPLLKTISYKCFKRNVHTAQAGGMYPQPWSAVRFATLRTVPRNQEVTNRDVV